LSERSDEHDSSPRQSTDFPAWYGEVVRRAGLAKNSPVRGAVVIKPYGYAIGEAIQRELDDRIKATGQEPLLPATAARVGIGTRKRDC
jgi:prolyl-tRNA synthetase